MQNYSDLGLYDRAERVMDRIQSLHESDSFRINAVQSIEENMEYDLEFDKQSFELIEQILCGREDMYTKECVDGSGRRKSLFIPEPLTKEVIKSHLLGKETIGTYLVRNNDTVHYIVIDIDVSRKVLIVNKDKNINSYIQKASEYTVLLSELLMKMGIKSYIEYSGYRGFHLWIFFTEWIPIRYAYSLIEIIDRKKSEVPDNITLEFFPSKNKKKSGSSGQNIKVPFGIHVISGKRCIFLDDDLQPVSRCNDFLSSLGKYSIDNIKRLIADNSTSLVSFNRNCNTKIELDRKKLGDISENISIVIDNCTLMKYLVNKAIGTGYLSHFERLSVLHVFGHIGDDGKEFVHKVMSFTVNYQYNITQKFIGHIPAKPVSCIKLREQYKQITAENGCTCAFKRTKNCYPSPVLHVLKNGTDVSRDITIPTSRTIPQSKKEVVYDELNIHITVQDLAEKIVELKKQKRGIEKSIKKVERELSVEFDNSGVDCMEVDMGMLVRRKNGDNYEWSIEI